MSYTTALKIVWLALLVGLTGISKQAQATDLATKVLASNCVVCHGASGKSDALTPRIYSRTAIEIERSLFAFAAGDKPGTIMNRIAKGYSPQQIKALAAYFGR